MLFQPSGETSLVRISVHELRTKTIAHDLDAAPNWNKMAVSDDGRSAFIALASAGAPDNAARHIPDANRWLAIYKVDLSTGARTPVVSTPGVDNNDPALAGGNLYWARNAIRDSVAAVPISGGDSKDVIAGAEVPMWSPDGKKISFTYGGWRLADQVGTRQADRLGIRRHTPHAGCSLGWRQPPQRSCMEASLRSVGQTGPDLAA